MIRILEKLPITIDDDHITFRGQQYRRDETFLSFIYPNPFNPKRYIYFLHTASHKKELWARDFANDMFFDYEIYNLKDDVVTEVDKGHFDVFWR